MRSSLRSEWSPEAGYRVTGLVTFIAAGRLRHAQRSLSQSIRPAYRWDRCGTTKARAAGSILGGPGLWKDPGPADGGQGQTRGEEIRRFLTSLTSC